MKNIKIIEVPSEIGAGTRGASLGIEAIKIAALDFMSNFFIHKQKKKIHTFDYAINIKVAPFGAMLLHCKKPKEKATLNKKNIKKGEKNVQK